MYSNGVLFIKHFSVQEHSHNASAVITDNVEIMKSRCCRHHSANELLLPTISRYKMTSLYFINKSFCRYICDSLDKFHKKIENFSLGHE